MFSRLAGVLSLAIAAQAAVIVPVAAWTDTDGNVIQAHGGGFLKVSNADDGRLFDDLNHAQGRLDVVLVG